MDKPGYPLYRQPGLLKLRLFSLSVTSITCVGIALTMCQNSCEGLNYSLHNFFKSLHHSQIFRGSLNVCRFTNGKIFKSGEEQWLILAFVKTLRQINLSFFAPPGRDVPHTQVIAAERRGCVYFVLDFLFLFDQAKKKENSNFLLLLFCMHPEGSGFSTKK